MTGQGDPAWVKCDSCDDYWCNIHAEHVYDCPCPGIDAWALKRLNPYNEGGSIDPDVVSEWEDPND